MVGFQEFHFTKLSPERYQSFQGKTYAQVHGFFEPGFQAFHPVQPGR
jgi:hypothetical protein